MFVGASHPETKPWIIDKVMNLHPEEINSILDVGAGAGIYCDVLFHAGFRGDIDAIEVWEPYINEFDLDNKYDFVFQEDVRKWDDFNYDLIIFGDILEHMTVEEALAVWDKVSKQAKYAVIAIPIIHYHQPAINNNPYEEHVKEDWSHEEVLNTFPYIVDSWKGEITGAYWAKFR
jgi:ABC-type taurine transport system substrate-binding protein